MCGKLLLRLLFLLTSDGLFRPSPQGCFLVLEEVLPLEVGTRLSSKEPGAVPGRGRHGGRAVHGGRARPAPGGLPFGAGLV